MASSAVKRDADETTDQMSDTSSLILCAPPPFKHKKLRVATSTTVDHEDPDCEGESFPASQKHFMMTASATQVDHQVAEDQQSINNTPQDSDRRDAAESHNWQSKITDAPRRPRASTPVRPTMYNSYMDDDEDAGECADCGARADAAASNPCCNPSESGIQRNNPAVKRLLNYGEDEERPCSANKHAMTSKVIPGGRLESCVLQLRSKQLEDTPRPGGLRRPAVTYGAAATAGPSGAGHGAAGPKFVRRVAMFTERPGLVMERRDKYSGLKRGAALHVEMSARKHIILKK